jgi:two-component system, LytTR family, response regulator
MSSFNPAMAAPDAPMSLVRSAKHIQAMVLERDPDVCARIRELLEADPEVEVVGTYQEFARMLTDAQAQTPDLMVLDVEAPELRDAGTLAGLELEPRPVTITTAYSGGALKNFAAESVDGVVKPINAQQFERALMLARLRIERAKTEDLLRLVRNYLDASRVVPEHARRFTIEDSGRLFFLKTDDIDWIQSAGSHVRLHSGTACHEIRDTMERVESVLDPQHFLRVHRSAIVNLDRVKEFQLPEEGNMYAVLHNGTRLPLSRNYRMRLRRALRGPFKTRN